MNSGRRGVVIIVELTYFIKSVFAFSFFLNATVVSLEINLRGGGVVYLSLFFSKNGSVIVVQFSFSLG